MGGDNFSIRDNPKCKNLEVKIFKMKNRNGEIIEKLDFSVEFYANFISEFGGNNDFKITEWDHKNEEYEFHIIIRERWGNKINAKIKSPKYTDRKLIGEKKVFPGY